MTPEMNNEILNLTRELRAKSAQISALECAANEAISRSMKEQHLRNLVLTKESYERSLALLKLLLPTKDAEYWRD